MKTLKQFMAEATSLTPATPATPTPTTPPAGKRKAKVTQNPTPQQPQAAQPEPPKEDEEGTSTRHKWGKSPDNPTQGITLGAASFSTNWSNPSSWHLKGKK